MECVRFSILAIQKIERLLSEFGNIFYFVQIPFHRAAEMKPHVEQPHAN